MIVLSVFTHIFNRNSKILEYVKHMLHVIWTIRCDHLIRMIYTCSFKSILTTLTIILHRKVVSKDMNQPVDQIVESFLIEL